MRKGIIIYLILALSIVICTGCDGGGSRGTGEGTITGQIIDRHGEGVPNVKIVSSSGEFGESDSQGSFSYHSKFDLDHLEVLIKGEGFEYWVNVYNDQIPEGTTTISISFELVPNADGSGTVSPVVTDIKFS